MSTQHHSAKNGQKQLKPNIKNVRIVKKKYKKNQNPQKNQMEILIFIFKKNKLNKNKI